MADETPFKNTRGQSYVQNYDFTPYASIRTMPVQSWVQEAISEAVYAADPNVQIRVSSAGQTTSRDPKLKGKPGGWIGSDRHNEGGAADFSLVRDGKKIPIRGNERLYENVARNLAAKGVPGIGVDMAAGYIHAGGGSTAAWGYQGQSNSSKYLPPSFAKAINEGRQLHSRGTGIPLPPGEIPNVVASQLDVQRPTPLPTPVTERRMMGTQDVPTSAMSRAYPTMNATPRLGNGGIFAYSAPDMQPAQITPGIGSLTPNFFSRPAQIDPVGLGPQSLATVQDMYGRPSLTASVPLPQPRPAMGGDPGGGTMGLPIASLPTTRASLPAIPSRATDTAPRPTQSQIRADNGQTSQRMSGDTRGGGVITPIATISTTRQAAATPAPASNVGRAPTTRAVQSVPVTPSLPIAAAAPVAPIAPAALTPIQAQRAEQLAMRNAGVSRPIVQPTAAQVEAATGLRLPNMAAQPPSVPKDQSQLTAGVLPAASAVPLASAPQIQVGPAPRAVTGYPTPVANRPAPLMAQVAAPLPRPVLPIAAQAPAPLRVSVNGANSYSAPAPTYVTTQTGKQAVSGSSYTGSDGYNYRVESDGTITNTKSGSNSGTWYNPDTNKFERR